MSTNYFAHPTAVIDQGAIIGSGVNIWHFSHIMPNAKIGDHCNIGQNVFIASGVVLGSNVKVQNNVSIYDGVTCQDDVFLGPSVVFTNVLNPRSTVNRKNEFRKTVVKKGASIGANATIVCGYNIGFCAFVGAGSVVTKEVPDYALVAGNPARQIGWMSENGNKLTFGNDSLAICKETGQEYKLTNNIVTRIK
jgi:UDP-2-acetamido-3-amino-2,3-dideoxy-glucuronate N-acetyltransferase